MTNQTDRTTAIYDAIDAFQRTHRLPGLQHAQIRGLLAEHLARTLPVSSAGPAPATDRDQLRDRIAEALRPHASLGGAPARWQMPFFDGATPSLPRISGWKDLDDVADAVLAVLNGEEASRD